jgi:drug/metabolite transporter (DMT)-like permease
LLSINATFTFSFGLGEMLILGCALANALHIVLISKFAPQADAINLATIQIALTALLNGIAIPIAHEQLAMPPLPVWGAMLFLGVVATAFTVVVMNSVQQYISSIRATLIYALEPVWTGLFGYFAGERLGVFALIGCACILLAMVLGGLPLPILNTALRKHLAILFIALPGRQYLAFSKRWQCAPLILARLHPNAARSIGYVKSF